MLHQQLTALSLLLSSLLLGACASFSPSVPIERRPDASLLLPCSLPKPPQLDDKGNIVGDDRTVGLGWLEAVQKLINCADSKDALIWFVKGGAKDKDHPGAPEPAPVAKPSDNTSKNNS